MIPNIGDPFSEEMIRQRMIPKGGRRFSEEIMRQKTDTPWPTR
jgi:hypothetical protein